MKIYYIGIICIAVLTTLFLIIGTGKTEDVGGDINIPALTAYLNDEEVTGNSLIKTDEKVLLDQTSKSLPANNMNTPKSCVLTLKTDIDTTLDEDILVEVLYNNEVICTGRITDSFNLDDYLNKTGAHDIIVTTSFHNLNITISTTYRIIIGGSTVEK